MNNQNLPILYIIRGLSGNGKTTLANRLTMNNVASDMYQGLYKNGIYQFEKQSASHKWCLDDVEIMMSVREKYIAVHNTFDSIKYMEPYLGLAKKYGYAVQIITSEGVFFPDGTRTQSEHNTPQRVIDMMKNRWESVNPPDKRGMSFEDLSINMTGLEMPSAIIFDLDGTLIKTKSGSTFAKTFDDIKVNPQCDRLLDLPIDCKLYIASNQRGIGSGNRTQSFLTSSFEYYLTISNHNIEKAYFAIGKDSPLCYTWTGEYGWDYQVVLNKKADKPHTGIFESIINNQITLDKNEQIWVVGDSHSDEFPSDWEFAKASQLLNRCSISYIPVEMINLAIAKI